MKVRVISAEEKREVEVVGKRKVKSRARRQEGRE